MVETEPRDELQVDLEGWIEAARRGDRDALGRALSSFRDYLLLVASEELDPGLAAKGGASDIVQETFFRAHRFFDEFRGRSENEWRNWLRAILIRRLSHHRRRFRLTAKRRQEREVPMGNGTGPAATDPTPSREFARREREAALLAALERLPEHYREVVVGHHRDRLTFEDIGRRRGISPEAARKLWTRALGCLRRELGPEFASP